jgi:hypothetical protein
MTLFYLHHVILIFLFVIGAISYALFIGLLCRGLAFGKRKDKHLSETSRRINKIQVRSTAALAEHLGSDCPALSTILVAAAAVGIVEGGLVIIIGNRPYTPLLLELTKPLNQCDRLQVVAYHSRLVENRLVRELEMTFEVSRYDHHFSLKVIRYSPAKSQYLSAFAQLWSEDLVTRGYVDAALSQWDGTKAA